MAYLSYCPNPEPFLNGLKMCIILTTSIVWKTSEKYFWKLFEKPWKADIVSSARNIKDAMAKIEEKDEAGKAIVSIYLGH